MSEADERAKALQAGVSSSDRFLVVVAGPNGAGKSTFVERFLKPTSIRIVNPDDIARALSPDAPSAVAYEAAQAAETVRRDLLSRGISFCMETVFSDPKGAKVAFLREARVQGYVVFLVFIGLDNSDLAIGRVVQRTEEGGQTQSREPASIDHARRSRSLVRQQFRRRALSIRCGIRSRQSLAAGWLSPLLGSGPSRMRPSLKDFDGESLVSRVRRTSLILHRSA